MRDNLREREINRQCVRRDRLHVKERKNVNLYKMLNLKLCILRANYNKLKVEHFVFEVNFKKLWFRI